MWQWQAIIATGEIGLSEKPPRHGKASNMRGGGDTKKCLYQFKEVGIASFYKTVWEMAKCLYGL